MFASSQFRRLAAAPLSLHAGRRSMSHCRLAVFDKDGTLCCDKATWIPVLEKCAQRMAPYFPAGSGGFLDFMGLDIASRAFRQDSIFAVATNWEIADRIKSAHGKAAGDAYSAWALETPPDEIVPVPIAPLDVIFQNLQSAGIKIAVLTSDDRSFTESFLISQGVVGMVDTMVCGDDGFDPKPHAEPLLEICERLGVCPSETAMVGDSARDVGCGRAASVGCAIGVLSGVHEETYLYQTGAHIVVPTIADVQRVLPSKDHVSSRGGHMFGHSTAGHIAAARGF
eukprot:TRINITY_DN2336_c0_g1_i1.p1 TRINITY_DN2336_c0_g1~~TRINITY_DN2336_c0_g1_i1.p1  ORF type:complete len:283 (+),score=45.52 TRINITY_DN2336_c0_g1_i1:81-929(+)